MYSGMLDPLKPDPFRTATQMYSQFMVFARVRFLETPVEIIDFMVSMGLVRGLLDCLQQSKSSASQLKPSEGSRDFQGVCN